MKPYKIIQTDRLEANLMNNIEIIKQMIGLFLGQGHQDFSELEKAVTSGDLNQVHAIAHHIKPTMEYIGANILTNKFQQLEQLAKNGGASNDIADLFSEIKQDFTRAMQELQDYSQSLS